MGYQRSGPSSSTTDKDKKRRNSIRSQVYSSPLPNYYVSVNGDNSVIDFQQYDEKMDSSNTPTGRRPTGFSCDNIRNDSTNTMTEGEPNAESSINLGEASSGFRLGISSEEVCSTIPTPILKTFVPESRTLSTVDTNTAASVNIGAFVKALVNTIARALNGDSVVTAPLLHDRFHWLGDISVKPGALNVSLFATHREYLVQARVLAGGHVLPWCIGRKWRYSELRTILVDDLQAILIRHDIGEDFVGLIESFPPKTWNRRNSEDLATFRSQAIQSYIQRLILGVNNILERRRNEKSARRKRWGARNALRPRVTNGGDDSYHSSVNIQPTHSETESVNADNGNSTEVIASSSQSTGKNAQQYFSNSPVERKNSFDRVVGEGLGEIMALIVNKLLSIDAELRHEVSTVSQDLRTLITSTPTERCHVAKDFKVMPQQAL